MLLRNELQEYDFYRKSLSLFMKNTPGILARCDMWTDILKNVLSCGDKIIELLNIFYYQSATDNYLTELGYTLSNTKTNFLDEVASIYGLSRQVVLTQNYKTNAQGLPEIVPKAQRVTGQITLTDKELLVLIESTIRRYNFNGTRQGLREIYEGTPLFAWSHYQSDIYPEEIKAYIQNIKHPSFLTELGIVYIDNNDTRAACVIAIDKSKASANIMNLFTNGLLTIESMGIEYTYVESTQFAFAYFNDAEVPAGTRFYQPQTTPYYIFADAREEA